MVGGTGASLKIPDYLAHGKMVISTPIGMRGFPWLEPYVHVAEREDFVGRLEKFIHAMQHDSVALERNAKEACDVVKNTLDWNVVCRELPGRIRSLISFPQT